MRKIKNIFINLLGAAVIAACTASTALAQWSTADYGGKNVTGDVLADRNSVSFLPAPGGNAYVVWTKEVNPGLEFGIAAQQLANSDGAYVWGSTASVVASVTMGANSGPDNSEANPDGSGGLLVKYVDEVSSNCYITDVDSSGAPRSSWLTNPLQVNSDPVVGCHMVPVLGGESFGFVMISTATDGEPAGSFIKAFNLNDGTVLAPFSGNGVAVGTAPYMSIPSPAGAGQSYPGAIFLNVSDDQQAFTAFRVDSMGAINWSVVYSTIANTNNVSLLPDGASGAYIVWTDIVTQHIKAIRINASGVQYPSWEYNIYANMYLNSTYGGFGDNGAWYAMSTASGVVVAWAEDVMTNAEIRAALFKADGSGIAWNRAVDTLLQGSGLSMDGSNLTISSNTAGTVAIAYQYGNSIVQKALNAAVLNSDGQTLVAGHVVMSGFPSAVSNHDAFAVDANNDFIVGVMISSSIYAQKITVPAAPAGAGFTGSFALPAGANFDGGNMDSASDTAYYNNSVYVVGVSSPAGGFIIRYSTGGVMMSSATFPSAGFSGVAVNANGVYTVGTTATSISVVKYTAALSLVNYSTAGYSLSQGEAIALSAAGNVFVTGSDLSTGDYHIAMFDSGLVMAPSENGFAGTLATNKDTASGVAVDGDNVYMAGHSLISGTTYFVLAKFSEAGYLSSYSSTSLSGVYLDSVHPVGGKIAVNPVTHDIYAALNASNTEMKLARFSQSLANLGTEPFTSANYAAASDLVIDSTGSVLVTGSFNSGADDYPVLLKYSPVLVFLSSAASVQTYGYEGIGLALDPVTGYSFVTGVYFSDGAGTEPGFDMRTVAFAPLAGGAALVRQISGTAVYTGPIDPAAQLTVWVSTSPDFRGTPYFASYSPSFPQGFTISNVPAGVYYLAMTGSINWMVADSTDPWGVHGQLGTPEPINVISGNASGLSVTMSDGNQIPNPWAPESQSASVYCGAIFATGGDCRINGRTTFATALAADASDNKYLLLTNLTDSSVVKFNNFGDIVSSVTVKYAAFNDIKINSFNGDFYVAAQGPVSGIRVFRYTAGLAFVSSYTAAGYQGARQLDFDAQGNVYAVSTKDNTGDYDIRVVKLSENLSGQLDDWSLVSAGPDQGYGIHVNGTDVFVAGIQRPGSVDEVAVIKVDATSAMTTAAGAVAYTAPFLFPEGQGFNNVRVTADATGVYAAYSANLLTSTGTAIYRFDRSSMATGFSSATLAGAYSFGDMKMSGTNLYVAAQSEMNQARVTKYAAAAFAPVSSKLAFVPMPYGMAPGALAFGVASEVYLAGVIPDGSGGLSGGVGAIFAVDGPVPGAEGEYIEGTDEMQVVADGAGGAYMVWDSTVAPGGLSMIYARHVGGTAWSQAVTAAPVSVRGVYALPDGSGGLYVGWFAGGQAYAQRYGPGGTAMLGGSGVQVSTGPVDGGEFIANPAGGLFAVFGYVQTETTFSLVAQSVAPGGSCLWPAGPCATSQGVVIPSVNFAGEGSGTHGADGSFLFFWGGDTDADGYMQINGAKIDSSGNLAWTPAVKSLHALPSLAQLGNDLMTAPDGAGGAYVLWSSSAADARTLYARRYDGATGAASAGWTTAVQITAADLPAGDHFNSALTADDEGFSVMYSTSSMFGNTQVRIVRALADGTGLAPGFTLGGKLLGFTSDGEQSFVYDAAASAYHIAFNPWATGLPPGNYHQVGYQKMNKAGDFLFNPYYDVGLSSDCVKIDVSTNGAGGALVGWIEKTGGASLPRLLNIPLGTGGNFASFTGDFSQPSGAVYDGGSFDWAETIAIDNLTPGGPFVYAAGKSSNTVTGTRDGIVIKYGPTGAKLAHDTFAGGNIKALKVLPDGSLLAGGYSSGAALRKYDSSLTLTASTQIAGSEIWAISYDGGGNVFVAGSLPGDSDGWLIAKLNPAIDTVVASQVYDSPNGNDFATGIAVRSDGNVIVTGGSNEASVKQWHMRVYDGSLTGLLNSATYYVDLSTDSNETMWFAAGLADDFYMSGAYSNGPGLLDGKLVHFGSDLGVLQTAAMGAATSGTYLRPYVDNTGKVIVSAAGDFGTGQPWVQKFSPTLVSVSSVTTPYLGFGAVSDSAGYAYITGVQNYYDEQDPANNIQTARVAIGAGAPPVATFSGNFSSATGAGFDYAGNEHGMDVAFYNGNIYAVGGAEGTGGLVIKYDSAGVMVSSAGLSGMYATGVAANSGGVYVAAQGDGTGFVTAKYSHDLVVSSVAVLPGDSSAREIALDAAGNVYVIGSNWGEGGGNFDYKVAKYDANLNQVVPAAVYNAGGFDEGRGIAADNGYVYVTGTSYPLGGGATSYALAKFDANTLAWVSSATLANAYAEFPAFSRVAVNPVTHDVYMAGTVGVEENRQLVTARYSADLTPLGAEIFANGPNGLGMDVKLDSFGNVYALGKKYDDPYERAFVAKYAADLVFLSSAVSAGAVDLNGFALDLDPATGISYVTGVMGKTVEDMATFRFAALPGGAPGAGFTGEFSAVNGSDFDGGSADFGIATAFYGSNVYVAGLSAPTGAMVVKYDLAGTTVAYAAFPGAESFDGIGVNANGVYVAGKGLGGFITAKYGHDLVLSSAAVLPGENHARDLALDAAGNVYVIGSSPDDYKFIKYDLNLQEVAAPVTFNAGGVDTGYGIAVDNGNIYVTGASLLGQTTTFVTAKFNSSLAFVSSAVYAGAYVSDQHPSGIKLAVNPATHEVYFAGTSGTEGNTAMLTVKYSENLAELVVAGYPEYYAEASDIAIDADGSVYALGINQVVGGENYAALLKYTPNLVFLSSATRQFNYGYVPAGIAMDPATRNSYVTGLDFGSLEDLGESVWNMRTFRFAPLPGGIAPAGTFSGDFAAPSGAVYAGPNYDYAKSLAVNPANGEVYATIVSSVAGNEQGLVVRYTASGGMSSSATLTGANGFSVGGVVLNANGVYVSAGVSETGALIRYDANLGLVSSTTLAGVSDPGVAVDASANVYLVGSGTAAWTLARYGADLVFSSSNTPNTALTFGAEVLRTRVWDLASDSGYIYAVGENWLASSAYYLMAKFDAATLAFVSSAAYANNSGELEVNAGIAVNANTHDVYVGLTGGTPGDRRTVTLRYSQDLAPLGQALYSGDSFEMGHDVIVAPDGYVYTLGKNYAVNYDHTMVLKYSPNLVFLSRADSIPAGLHSEGNSLAMNSATGNLYVAGFKNTGGGGALDPTSDAATVRLAPIGGTLPVVYVSSADVSPAFYLAGQEAAALKLVPYTLTGEVGVSGLYINVNPVGVSTHVYSVGLYSDSNTNDAWDMGDSLVSSGIVTGSTHFFDFSGLGAVVGTAQEAIFVTLTPTISAEGSSLRVSVPSSGSFITEGNMAQQAIYPITSAPKSVNYLAAAANFAAAPGAGLTTTDLAWSYTQDVAEGHFIIRYSTNPADLASPNSDFNQLVVPFEVPVTTATPGLYTTAPLPLTLDGLRVLPRHFALWLYNGTSTSTVSMARNMHFPVLTATDGDAVLNRRRAMSAGQGSGAKYARSGAGAFSAFTFSSESRTFLALNMPDGTSYFHYDAVTPLMLKDLAADPAGNAYALLQRGSDAAAVKFAANGSVAWNSVLSPSPETAKAIAWGGGAVYIAAELENGPNSQDIHLYKRLDSNGDPVTDFIYDTAYLYGAGSFDEVNSLAFTSDPSGAYLYAAGVSGASQMAGTLHKFADSGAVISTVSTGNWPVRHNNPSGDYARALAVKADLNGNLLLAGSEQRYDLNQGANLWLNKYNSYGASLFSVPARYNNPQGNADDIPAGLDFDQFGNIYVSGYTDMWNMNQGYNMLLAKFGPGGQFQSARVYDGGFGVTGVNDSGSGVLISTDNYAHVAGSFGSDGYFGVYSMPIGGAVANVQFFNAMEGPHTGSVDLMWNYTGRLPAGSTYYVQYSADAAPVWSKASAQISAIVGPEFPGAVQSRRIGALPTLRYPGQQGAENRGNMYKFKVWITSGGLTTELAEAQTFARTPNAFDDTRYFGFERLSFMSGLSMPPSAITVDGAYVYHAFSGRADGANAGFGLRKYNTGQYLEWTKFFNHRDDRSYQVGNVTRDGAGNFYIVGTQYPYNNVVTGPEIMVAGKDSWIAKLNPAGDLAWSYASDVSGLGRMDELYDAAVEGDYLYVVGAASTSANGMNVLAMKYDLRPSTGPAQVWSYTLDGSVNGDDFGYGVAVGTGAVYLSGTMQNSTKDAIVIALNKTNGSLVGAPIQINDPALNEQGYDLAVTTTTPPYVYLGGSLGGLGGSAYEDGALFKYTLAGVHEWTRTFDGKDGLDDEFYALEATDSGIIVAGYTQTGPEGKNSVFRKYTHAGNVAWTRGFNLVDDGDPYTTNPGDDEAYGLALGADGRVYSSIALWGNNPGFYYFPEPNFGVTAQPGYVPSSVRLQWMSSMNLQAGSAFHIQYSTFSGVAWSSAAAQVRLVTDYDIYEGMSVDRAVYGLNSGRDMTGASTGPLYYFKIWAVPPVGNPGIVSDVPAAARAGEGWAFENMVMYPNEAKLFVMGSGQQYYYDSGELEFPGIARDLSGNLYTLANMDWNGNAGVAVKKFNSVLMPVWTRYYAPGEGYQVKANRMAVDAAGSLYIAGTERNPSSSGKDLFVLKLGENGVAWKTAFDFAGGDDAGYGVAVDASGNVYAAGSADANPAPNVTDANILLAKFNSAGTVVSSVTYSGSSGDDYEAAYGIAVQGSNVYAAGSSYESGQDYQFWMGRYQASNLAQVAVVTLGDDATEDYEEAAYDVTIGSTGIVYFSGQLYTPENGSLDAAVVKSSANFTALWAAPVRYNSQASGVDSARGIALDASGAIYAAGFTERYDINQNKNLWLRKFAPDGSELWTQEFHANTLPGDTYAMGPTSDQGYSLAVGTMGFVSVSGRFNAYNGLYRYKQTSVLAVNPTLIVNVSSYAAGTPFPGVDVVLIPFSPTGGIDVSGSTRALTNASGTVSFQVPAGKQYFIALDKQGYNPSIKDQQMDPYGNFFVQLNANMTKSYTLSPRSAANPYYPLTVRVSSAAANDYLVAEVFFTQTGEKAAYGIGRVPAGVTATTITITNLPPATTGAYTLGITIPNRNLAKSVVMNALFPGTSQYSVSMSTLTGAVATTGGFDVGASTTPPSVEGVVKDFNTWAPIEQARILLYNESCRNSPCAFNSYETLSDVNGKFSFYNVPVSTVIYSMVAQKANYKRRSSNDISITTFSAVTSYREYQLEKATYTLRGYIRYRDVPVPNAEVMVWGDNNSYATGADSYKNGFGMDADARTKTAADGSFVFSSATANGLPDGQVRMNASFFGNWMDLNEGNNKDTTQLDADDVRVVISSGNATGVANSNCTKGRAWKLNANTGACQSLASGEISFNIMPPSQNDYAIMSGSVTFVTSFTVTTDNPLIISTMAPITVMAQQESTGSYSGNMSMGFAVISGTYTVNYATYSITLSTGVSYYTRVTSNEWGEVSSFNDRADFRSTMTTSVRMNFVVTKAGKLTGVVKMPDGSNYKPNYTQDQALYHRMDINVNGQNVSVSEGWNVDDYGAFEFPNLAPGLYTISMRPQGQGFRWAAPSVRDIAVVAGKTTQVTLKLENGLYVQPQIIGLPDISTPTWHYVMIPVPTGTEMNQAKITSMFFDEDVFAFDYDTTAQTWDKKIMQVGQYDFYLMMVARYSPEGGGSDPLCFDQFSNFIGKVKGYNVQRNDSTPNLGTEFQPLPVNVLGSLGQDTFEGTIAGRQLYTDADLDRIFSNMEELFPVIPSVMIYDAAGDLRGYTAGMPSEGNFPAFWAALGLKDKAQMRDYFEDKLGEFMVPGLPPGRYTVVFNNPNYPPVAKEIDIPLAAAYPFDFDAQNIRVGTVHGTVRSTAPVSGAYPALDNAVVYLKHKTVEKFTETAADGSFRFENLPAGIYRLEVTREGFVKAGGKTSLAGFDSSRLNFYLTPSQTSMTGKVYLSKFPAPLTKSGVKVVAYDETFNVERPTEYLPKIEATTNDSGEYELPGVVPGHHYKVTAFLGGKQPAMLDISSETVTEGITYLPDIVLRDVPPQIVVKVRRSPDSVNKADVTIKSPKALVTTPVCKVNPGEVYVTTSAVSLALVPGPNNTYQGQFIISMHQPFYNVYVAAGDGSNRMEKSVTFSPNNQAKTEQYIQDEAIQGGEVQMDKESEEYSGIELDTGGLAYSTYSATASSDFGNLVGGFFSALPSVRTVKTAKGDLSLTQAITDLMASEIYNMELQNASANKAFTLTLKYDKDKAVDNANLRIYQYDETTDGWNEVPGNYTTDPMLGVLSVGVASLSGASQGASAASTPLGRKRMGMSAVVNGRYVPSAAGSSSSGRFAVFTARPAPSVPYASADYDVANLPNPFNLKDKTVTSIEGTAAFSGANTYTTRGTLIKYHLPPGKSGSVKFVIYNLAGEKVRTISDGVRAGGQMYYSEWDGKNDTNQDVASGVYFMLTYVGGEKLGTKAHKLAVIK